MNINESEIGAGLLGTLDTFLGLKKLFNLHKISKIMAKVFFHKNMSKNRHDLLSHEHFLLSQITAKLKMKFISSQGARTPGCGCTFP